MSSLFEVVFENIVKNRVIRLFMFLIAESDRIICAQCSEDVRLIVAGEIDTKALDSILNYNGDVTVLVNLDDMKVGNLILSKVLLRLVKYGERYDIDFNFDSNELENEGMMRLIKELHDYAKNVARDNEVSVFFGGIEPASDEDSRYFTNDELGPLLN
jgi:hypothetical protein